MKRRTAFLLAALLACALPLGACSAVNGALEGLGNGGPSLGISLLRYTLVMIPTAWLLSCLMGPTGVWHAFWISEAVTALLSVLIYRRSVR